MNRPTLSLPMTRWEIAETKATNQFLRDHRLAVRPTERTALAVHLYLQDIHLPRRHKHDVQ